MIKKQIKDSMAIYIEQQIKENPISLAYKEHNDIYLVLHSSDTGQSYKLTYGKVELIAEIDEYRWHKYDRVKRDIKAYFNWQWYAGLYLETLSKNVEQRLRFNLEKDEFFFAYKDFKKRIEKKFYFEPLVKRPTYARGECDYLHKN